MSLPPPVSDTCSRPTKPIPIPRRRTAHPPPCSPTRDQNSPELVFNFDFSVSPDDPQIGPQLLLQQRGPPSTRRFPLQQNATYTPLAALGTNHGVPAHPYAREPFLYTIPKLPLQDTQNTPASMFVDPRAPTPSVDVSKTRVVSSASSSLSSLSSLQSSEPSCPPSADASMHLSGDADENFLLTSAFQRPLVSASVTSSSKSSFETASLSPSAFYHSPSPSPPRYVRSDTRNRDMGLHRPTALRRTTAAAPVVSLNVAQAQRSDRVLDRRERSPYSGTVSPRTKRSSSVGAGHAIEKVQDPGRRMATVVGRGAGRVISMFEYTYGGGRSLVSDEDIEQSLEKEARQHAETSGQPERNVGRGRREKRQQAEQTRVASPEVDRGRARGRASARGGAATARSRALPGWQWMDAP